MNFILRILAIDVPDNASLVFPPELSFRGFTLGWLLAVLLLMLLGMAAVVFFNLLEKGTLGWFRRIILIGLRAALLLLLLFLIMRPVLLAEFKGERPQGVALLIDNSQSMQQRDRRLSDKDKARVAIALGLRSAKEPLTDKIKDLPAESRSNPARLDLVKGMLKHKELNLLDDLKRFGPVRPYLFGADARGLQDSDAAKKDLSDKIIESLKGEEGKTALSDSIIKVLQSKDGDPPSAIVVFTDGQDNVSKFTLLEAAEKCRLANVPLHIWGVGSSEGGQLQLREVASPDTLFVDDHVAIPIRWRAAGFKQGTVEIVATLGGKEIMRKTVAMQTGEDLRDVLAFTVPKDPEKRDSQDLVTTIKYQQAGETVTDKVTRSLRVIDAKIKILYIEHSPRWEFKFLQPALLRDKRIEVDFILVNAVDEAKKVRPFIPEFPKTKEKFKDAKYNLIILGDVASSYFSKDQMEWIKEFVQDRGGLIIMAGRQHMPSSYENTPIGDMLPIEFKKEKFGLDAEARPLEYKPTLTAEGLRTDWLALADTPEENQDVWQKKLQGFYWLYPTTKLKPGATALIVHPTQKFGEPPQAMPILATHTYGKGPVIWLSTDETWRWRWNYQDKYFVRFWGQLIYQVGLPNLLGDHAKRAQMALEHSQAMVNKAGRVYVRLLDKEFAPRKDTKVEGELEYADVKPGEERRAKVTLTALPGRPGEYVALLPHHRPGRVTLHVNNPEPVSFQYRVDLPPKHELEESGMSEAVLREAARISRGHFYREEDLHELPGKLKTEFTKFSRRQEILLWNPLAILLFLGLLTVEWVLRKFSDLS